ncbi:beta-1,6-N-acetylglucosaminyltransferase [Thermoflavifilum thermophilum]|uniref:Peptide O-xylosyltransferase n=1 Tax=Thermoflavifilum thermophilum TaxID=1393122 RepID=A0A1I7NEJ3_9BACT|nr:beta-1,6-N-acetylglucosaminyltransferase [Thermoflavifilum thermophilum]SFV33003.1 Core-2/I-Branching enzyme [Thermoflavifilum thermophilum]
MRMCYLIQVHKYPEQVARLVKRIAHPSMDIYIHVDRKADESIFRKFLKNDEVHFIQKRVDVRWAGFSNALATVNGLREIISTKINYDYIHVISGQDYPIKSNEYIVNYFRENAGKEFMMYKSIYDEWIEALPKIEYYHFEDWKIKGKYRLSFILKRILPKRKFPYGWKPYGYSRWFSITTNLAEYMLNFIDNHPEYVRFFKYTTCGDEIFFCTIAHHSPFAEKIVNDDLRYVDWSTKITNPKAANPKILTREDFEKLKNSSKLWARKFDMNKDKEILNQIDQIIQ